jgi:hypothetical protein
MRIEDVLRKTVRVGTAIKPPCRVATTANITLSGLQTIDGVVLVADDRVLVKDQTSPIENGIYVAYSGPWVRAKDFDGNNDVVTGTMVSVDTSGNLTTYHVTTANPITVGVTSLAFATTTAVLASNGTVSAPGIAFSSDPDTGIYRIGADNIGIAVGGVKAIDIGVSVVVSTRSFGLSGNISAAAWTTSGVRYKNVAATLTDTTSTGTVPTAYTDLWGGNTIAASSAATFTNYFTSYFTDPIAGANVTLTNKWAIGADSLKIAGISALGGAVTVTATSASSLTVGRQGATNPVIQIDAATASVVTGIKVTGAASGGGIALAAISSASNEAMTINAKGTGTIGIGTTSTGNITLGNTSMTAVAIAATTDSTTTTTGALTIAGGLGVAKDFFALNVNATTALKVAGTKVVGAHVTGYSAMTGTPDKATAYDTSTVTLPQLAGRVAQLQADLTTHGLIGA